MQPTQPVQPTTPVEQQTTEVRETNVVEGGTAVQRQTVAQHTTVDNRVVAKRVVWYIIGFILVLLAIRVVLLMLGANRASSFVDLVYAVSGVFAAPFNGIFGTPSYDGKFFLDSASLVAMAVYALVGWGVGKLFTLTSAHPEA